MKRKPNKVPKVRNSLVPLVLFRKSGAHVKTNKAKRKGEKQRPVAEWL